MMADRRLLFRLVRGLRYEPLHDLIGKEVTVHSPTVVFDRITALAEEQCDFALELPDDGSQMNDRLLATIGKYGLIDFACLCDATVDAARTENGQLLRDFGFAPRPGEDEDPSPCGDDGNDCLEQLEEEVSHDRAWLKLFFRAPDIPFDLDLETRWRRMSDPTTLPLPLDFRVVDACVTNAPSIWLLRHLYL
jgi:hypothetical protein